ncbi:hypothetical protein RVIR1_11890 [Candidatus Rickettsiella viridis]|uniref:Uncharacterized protein n=1 Tax=Candidatus Rickettsiella viridis TaxID=676208 RepID=A0A2Z5UX26_9COXI|nr:hypothetical protein RVIR1_11890 [Candidatus Rickettsiella viridis]
MLYYIPVASFSQRLAENPIAVSLKKREAVLPFLLNTTIN